MGKIDTLSSCVAATSMADLPWQLTVVGSAPWLSRSEQTSVRPLDAASCNGENCHRSRAPTLAPWRISNSVTSKWPYLEGMGLFWNFSAYNFNYLNHINIKSLTSILIYKFTIFSLQFLWPVCFTSLYMQLLWLVFCD